MEDTTVRRDDAPATSALDDALDGLRRQLAERFPEPEDATDWMELYESLRGRLQAFGMSDRSSRIDPFGLDEDARIRALPLLDFLFERWWRVSVAVAPELPTDRPCLFVANRAGLLPWDGLMICHALARREPRAPRARFLVADWLITLPFAQPRLARLGGVRACRENAERLLRVGESVVAFPEGVKGAAKVFRERYRLQRFGRGGVVRTALSAGVPLVPVAVVGAEEAHPVLFKIESLAGAAGLPFIPVTPTFPALGPLGLVPLPTKWQIRIGAPIDAGELGPGAADDDLLIWRLTQELRSSVQTMVEQGLSERSSVWG